MAKELPVTYNLPEEVKPAVRAQAGYLIMLCPGWVNHLYVDFDSNPGPDNQGTLAHIKTDYAYRRVYLTVFGRWLWENEQARKECIVHEACHILNAPIQSYVETAVKAAFKDDKRMEDLFEAGWRVANESATEDMSRALLETAGWGVVELDDEMHDAEAAEPGTTRGTEVTRRRKKK